jgi:hypothetical protein
MTYIKMSRREFNSNKLFKTRKRTKFKFLYFIYLKKYIYIIYFSPSSSNNLKRFNFLKKKKKSGKNKRYIYRSVRKNKLMLGSKNFNKLLNKRNNVHLYDFYLRILYNNLGGNCIFKSDLMFFEKNKKKDINIYILYLYKFFKKL